MDKYKLGIKLIQSTVTILIIRSFRSSYSLYNVMNRTVNPSCFTIYTIFAWNLSPYLWIYCLELLIWISSILVVCQAFQIKLFTDEGKWSYDIRQNPLFGKFILIPYDEEGYLVLFRTTSEFGIFKCIPPLLEAAYLLNFIFSRFIWTHYSSWVWPSTIDLALLPSDNNAF